MAQGLIKSDRSRDGLAAALLSNVGELEDAMYEMQGELEDAMYEMQGDLQETLDGIDAMVEGTEETNAETESMLQDLEDLLGSVNISRWSRLNRPNLLKQPQFTTRAVPSSAVISEDITIPAETAAEAAEDLTYTITDQAITSSYVLIGVRSRIYAIAGPGNMACVASAGSATITVGPRNDSQAHDALTVTVYLCTTANAPLPYGTISRSYATGQPYLDSINDEVYPGELSDQISESVVTLTGNDIITEPDGETYDKAIAFTVANPPSSGWGNADKIIWNYSSNRSIEMENGAPKYRRYGELEMTAGKKYTLSCWARVTSGTKACLWIGVCPRYYWRIPGGYEYREIDANNGEWQRVVLEVEFNPTGDQFYTYTNDNVTYQACNWDKSVGFGVCRKYAGTVQLCGFRLVEGGLYLPTKYDEIKEQVEALGDGTATAAEAGAIITEYGVSAS